MNYLLPLIILIILACVYAGSLKNPKSRLTVVVVVLAFILVLCWLQMRGDVSRREGFSGFGGYAPLGYNMRIAGDNGSSTGCGGYNYADVNSQVGSSGYDGIKLKWDIPTRPLLASPVIFSNVGDAIPLTQPLGGESFPSIDGNPNSPKHMFTLARNQSSWDCCPSPFGTDGGDGCLCLSKEQLDMFKGRGYNKTSPETYPDM